MTSQQITFNGIFENRPSKIIGAILCILLSFFTFTSVYGIIWFEKFGSDLKRIFINRIVSSICWYFILYLVVIQIPELFWFFYQPMPEFLCLINLFLRNAFFTQVVLFLDVIVISRYIFVFWMKDPLSFQDDFWHIFINIWIVIFRLVLSLPYVSSDLTSLSC
jgi:hypothetical protein